MSAIVTRDTLLASAVRGLIWRAEHTWTMDAGAPMYFGWVVPEIKMVSLGREYITPGKSLKVDLYEASFTGGTNVTTLNRDLGVSGALTPIQAKHSVTPGALTNRITGFNVETLGAVRVGRLGNIEPYMHPPLVSYVLAIENLIAGAEPYSFFFDFRLMFPDEDK